MQLTNQPTNQHTLKQLTNLCGNEVAWAREKAHFCVSLKTFVPVRWHSIVAMRHKRRRHLARLDVRVDGRHALRVACFLPPLSHVPWICARLCPAPYVECATNTIIYTRQLDTYSHLILCVVSDHLLTIVINLPIALCCKW